MKNYIIFLIAQLLIVIMLLVGIIFMGFEVTIFSALSLIMARVMVMEINNDSSNY